MRSIFFSIAVGLFLFQSCKASEKGSVVPQSVTTANINDTRFEKAYFASGCFWCVEAVFESVNGVAEVISGYAGGEASTANYSDVSSGRSKHAESVEVYYDPSVISFETLLVVFFGSHDPTTYHQQGPDKGSQYRSAIFFTSPKEKKESEDFVKKLYADGVFSAGSITTEIVPLEEFYPAEDYHQNFERLNPDQGYVKAVSIPRLRKFQNKYPHLLKSKKEH